MIMQFGILGPLEVSVGGRPVEVTGGRQRALLAVLLLDANRVVPVERLVDALWGDAPPETAAKAVQVLVSQLRKALGRERLVTKAPGYVLRVGEGELDVDRFERLVEEGEFSGALRLWRGSPLAEFAELSFAGAEIARLDELRLTCLEGRVARELEDGRHGELVGELERLVREHPLRERLRGQLMLALYRSGRQAEALNAYQEARHALVDELGIEPGRALRELHQQILNQDAELEPGNAQEPVVVEQPSPAVDGDGPPPRETRKTVTVLCTNVATASTEGGRIDPEAMRRVVGRTLSAVKESVEHHGGSVKSSTGGLLTAVFGIPTVHEDDAARAARAAAEIAAGLQQAADLDAEVPSAMLVRHGIGLGTGEVVVGGELEPIGEPFAAAQHLARIAAPGEVVLDRSTYRLVRDIASAEPRDEDGYRLLEPPRQSAVTPRRFRSPLVGRERERRRLHDAFAQAVSDRSCQLFSLLGAAGVGKSRLVEEFLEEIGSEALVVRGRCLPYGEGITFWPVMEVVKEAVGLSDGDSPDEAIAKLAGALADDQGGEHAARRIAEMIGLVAGSVSIADEFADVRALFVSLSRRQPLVIVWDDIHWGEATFLDLVEHLADWTRDAPLLLACLARPELLEGRPGWAGGKLNATSILLEPLSEDESAVLIENLQGAFLDERTKQRIVAASEGNPLFVEEMLALAVDGGAAESELEVPPTIQALLAARLDRLSPEERSVIEPAAVAGKVFHAYAIHDLAPAELRDAVADSLASLVRKEVIRPDRPSLGGPTYRFRHLLIRDAAYEAVPKEVRASMHERFGRWLEDKAGERSVEYEEIVGYHLEQAHRYRRELGSTADPALAREAAERLGAAGRRAFIRSDAPAGVNLISRAVALLRPDDPLRVELIPNVRVVQGAATDMSWAERALTEAVEAAATSGDRQLAAQALVQRGLLRLFTEADVTAEELIDTADRAIDVFTTLRDELGLARAWRLKAQAHYLARHGQLCVDASERALEHARRAANELEESEVVEWLGIAMFLGPTHAADASSRCRELIAETEGRPILQLHLLSALGGLESMLGHDRAADEVAARCKEIMGEVGVGGRSFGAAPDENPVIAEDELRRSYEGFARLGEKRHFNSICAHLARAVYAQGRYDEAERLTYESEAAARPNDVHSHILWRSTRAKVLARRDDFADARRLAQDAVEFAAASDFYAAHGDALADLAEVLELEGEREDAAAALHAAIALYDRKGSVFGRERASVRLARLRA
jgi:DNA-binding SARP family transcriptional activator